MNGIKRLSFVHVQYIFREGKKINVCKINNAELKSFGRGPFSLIFSTPHLSVVALALMKIKILFLVFWIVSCESTLPQDDRIKLIIDADTANEVDDLFAIVRALSEPSLDVLGICSAQFHTSPLASDTTVLESQAMNQDIVRLLNLPNIPLPVGSNRPMVTNKKAAPSQASRFIIDQVKQLDAREMLHVVVLGSCTNVASAILEDPTIIPQISVDYIGFWHDAETNTYDKKEFNSGNDTIAVNLLLNTEGLDFNVMTASTCQHLVFDRSNVEEQLNGKGPIADYMIKRWNSFDRWWTEEDPEKQQWIMWDVAIIEALINPHLAIKETFTTPPENTKRYIEAYTHIEVESMKMEFWNAIQTILN